MGGGGGRNVPSPMNMLQTPTKENNLFILQSFPSVSMISVIYFQHLEHLVIPCYTNYVSKVIANPDTKAHKKSFCHLCQSQACYEKLIY